MAAVESYLGQEPLRAGSSAAITEVDFLSPYVEAISVFADLKRIASTGQKYAIDCMYGAGRGVLAGIFASMGIDHVEIRAELNPLFPGIQPEPIPPHIHALEAAVLEHHCQAGFATDGDADRIGAVDEKGTFVDANKITWFSVRDTVVGMAHLFTGRGTNHVSSSVGIVRVSAAAWRDGARIFLSVLAEISLALGILNLVFALWMRLLHRVEGSVLWLFEGNATAVKQLRAQAASCGIAGERLIFAPRLHQQDHLARQPAMST